MSSNINIDPFGVKKLYPTSAFGMNNRKRGGNGWEYFAEYWNNRKYYEFVPNDSIIQQQDQDIYAHFRKVPNSFFIMKGDGSLNLTTDEKDQPMKISLYDDNNLYYGTKNALSTGKRWTSNVEFTVYFNIKSFALRYGFALNNGISIHLCSDHHFIDYQHNAHQNMTGLSPANSREYYLKMQYDGHMYLGGEPWHPAQRSQKPDGVYDIDYWDTDFTGIPLDSWIGIKLVKHVVDTKDVYLEVWRDTTSGFEGGTWRKMFEFLHTRGNWYNTDMDAPYAAAVGSSPNWSIMPLPPNVDDPHVDGGGGQCYLQIDPIHEIEIKYLSCRDIEPFLLPPVTTDAELLSDSPYFADNGADTL